MTTLIELLRPAVASAVLAALADAPAGVRPAARAEFIADRALDAVEADPALRHAANAEPWYRSRVTLGAILSALAPLLGLFGMGLTPEHQDAIVGLIVGLGAIVGPALTLYGRWAAKTPLGA